MRRLSLTIDDAISTRLEAIAHEPIETAAVLIVSVAELDEELRLIGRELIGLGDHVSDRLPNGCTVADVGLVAAAKAAEALGAGIVLVHNHPAGDLAPSTRDRRALAVVAELARTRLDKADVMSMIVGPGGPYSFTGTTSDGVRLERIRVVGRRFRFLDAADVDRPAPPPSTFDRQVRAFGAELQQLLGTLTAGVAGFGGTGSAVGQQLIRLGIGTVIVADDDIVTGTNVTRIHASELSDAGLPKADLAQARLEAIGFGKVEPITDAITVEAVARRLRSCDVIFGCTDDHAGRLVLARLAAHYRIPVIDMGVRLGAQDGTLTEIIGRVSVVTPGAACGICTGTIDPAVVAAEMLLPEERERRAADGYVPDLDFVDPAVITYTTLVASLAVHEMLERLIGFGVDPPPDEIIVLAHDRYLSTRTKAPRPGHFCCDPKVIGSADTTPFLGVTWAA